MPPDERVMLARLTYLRAVASARWRSTPATWARLLTAAKNRKAALLDRERSLLKARPGPIARLGHASPGRCRPGRPVPPGASPSSLARRWPALHQELARSRALIAWSRALVRQSRALGAALAALRANDPGRLAGPGADRG